MRKSKRMLALLVVLTMLATMFIGVPAASAASTYSASLAPAMTKATLYNDGGTVGGAAAPAGAPANRITVDIPAGQLLAATTIRVSMPSDYAFIPVVPVLPDLDPIAAGAQNQVATAVVAPVAGAPAAVVPVTATGVTATNQLTAANTALGGFMQWAGTAPYNGNAYREWDITVTPAAGSAFAGRFYIDLYYLFIPSGADSEVKLTIDAPPTGSMTSGQVTVATVGTGKVDMTIDEVKKVSSTGGAIGVIRIKEDRAGAQSAGANSIKIKLPNGFTWSNTVAGALVWGTLGAVPAAADVTRADDNRTLVIAGPAVSAAPTYYTLSGLTIAVDDTIAKTGDVVATISGNSTVSQSEITVAKYSDFEVTVSAFGDPLDVKAGRIDEEIGKIQIEEGMAGSLVAGRTVTLTLTGGAKWRTFPSFDASNSNNYVNWAAPGWALSGTLGDTIKATTAFNASAAKIVLKAATIDVSPAASGEIKVIVGGTAGATGEVVVANVVKPVTASIEGAPAEIAVGAQGVELPSIIIAENMKEAISASTTTTQTLKAGVKTAAGLYWIDGDGNAVYNAGVDTLISATDAVITSSTANNVLSLEFPMDTLPSMPTAVEVIEGDIVLDQNSISRGVTADGRWAVNVTIKSTSSTPSKIKFSGIKLSVNRTLPEGDMKVAVKGAAIVQTAAQFPGYTSIAAPVVAKVVTAAAGDSRSSASFVIGNTTYTLNGVEQTMDVAPYIKGERTFMPVRYVAYAMGVSEQNVIWDDVAKTVTLMKGDKVVQVKIGSTTMYVNGIAITMDVAPEITGDRTMLPIRFLANAFGVTTGWDAATNTVSIN